MNDLRQRLQIRIAWEKDEDTSCVVGILSVLYPNLKFAYLTLERWAKFYNPAKSKFCRLFERP